MNAADIRDLFRDFFVAHGHLAGEPASLVPAGDTSVLFTTAGMQQYKPYFLGVETPPATRITTCQRSFRTSDIENVGKTARHLTFFEMLGNFSFGDYFKAEAIEWALGALRPARHRRASKVWVSVFGGDDQVPADEEAVELWKSHGFPDDRIVRLGRSDNFWGPAGPTGPCGPCSELYYDFGPEMGCDDPDCKPGCDCDRYLEYWNLVFVQYDMDEAGNAHAAAQAAASTPAWASSASPSITQGVTNVFETDLFAPLVEQGAELAGVTPRRVAGRHPRPAHAWPSTRAARRSSSWTASCPATTAATTCCGASSAAPCSRPWRSASRSRSSRRSPTRSSSMMGGAYPELVDAAGGDPPRRRTRRRSASAARWTRAWASSRRPCAALATRAPSSPPRSPSSCTTPTASRSTSRARSPPSEDMTVDEERFGHLMEEQRERARAAQKEGAFASGPARSTTSSGA